MAGIVTRRPLVLQLHKTDEGGPEYAEFLHLPKRRFSDFGTLFSLLILSIPVLGFCFVWMDGWIPHCSKVLMGLIKKQKKSSNLWKEVSVI